MPVTNYAKTYWCAQDIVEEGTERGFSISRREAEALLRSNEEHIAEAMVHAGWSVIEILLASRNRFGHLPG